MPLSVRPRHVAGLLVAGLVGLVVVLAVTRSTPISTSGFTPFSLEEIDLAELRPAEPVDYLELRESFDGAGGEIRASWGTACETATLPAACRQELAELTGSAGPAIHQPCGICSSFRLFATRGDEVLVIGDLDSFLGTVDTATEAALAAGVAAWVMEVDGGWHAIESHLIAECDPIVELTTLNLVTPDGAVTELDRHQTTERGACI